MNRYRLLLPFICCVLIVTGGIPAGAKPVAAGTLLEEIQFDRQDLSFSTVAEYDLVTLPSACFTEEIGAPLLPVQTIHILLPPASRLRGVEILGVEHESLGSGYLIHPCQPPVPTDGSSPPDFVGPSAVYQSNQPYPAASAVLVSENSFAGFRLASVNVYPLSYRPKSGELILNRAIRLAIHCDQKDGSAPPKLVSLRTLHEMERVIGALVKNSGMIDRYREQALIELDTRIARPLRLEVKRSRETDGPLDEPGQLEYLIITTGDFEDEFQVLADWKTKKGIPAAVVTTSWIAGNYPQGCDLQETIRNFIVEVSIDHPGLAYVLIGGDVDQVPVRFAAKLSGDLRTIPTDLYYGDIDPLHNWNDDGDAEFGEYGDGQDAVPDLYVGRAPVNNAGQAAIFVDKTLFWERELPFDHCEKILMLGASNTISGDGRGARNKEAIGADLLPPNILAYYLCGPQSGSYGGTTWDCDAELTRQSALDQINAGYLFVNHQDHSNEYEIGAGTRTGGGAINRSDMDALSNGPFYSVLFTLGCSPGAFDYDCVIEHFVRNPDGGGPLVIGNSRTGYWDQDSQDRALIEALYQSGLNLGQATAMTKTAGFSLYYRYVQNTLGDPELPFYTEVPGLLDVVHPSSVPLGPRNITVTVTDQGTGLAVEGAVVCAMKGLEDYAVGITGSGGSVTFTFDTDLPGEISITVSSPNYLPAESSIIAYAANEPFVNIHQWSVDDDSSGTSLGNGDGVIDAGETVELPVTLRNIGPRSANYVRATLSMVTSSPYLTITDNYEYFGNMPAGSIVTSLDDFDIVVDPDCPAGHTVEMKLIISAPKISIIPKVEIEEAGRDDERRPPYMYYWDEYFTIRVAAPDLLLVSHEVLDSGGNGIVDPDEQVSMPITLKNCGRGTARGVTAQISCSSSDVLVLADTTTFNDIPYLEEVPSTTYFFFQTLPSYNGEPIRFDLVISDEFGNMWTSQMDVAAPPAAPTGLAGLAGGDDVFLTWDAHGDPALAGYHVYRSDFAGGRPQRVNHEMVQGASCYHDTGLAGATWYLYKVTAVNTSGRESATSTELAIQTTVENQDGWPIVIGGGVSSPLIIDIDDDGDLEVIFGGGDAKLYAFHHGGEEVLDIDLNPTTISGFATAVGTVGTPSAADIDNDGFQEIVAVANSGATHRVYAWRHYDGADEDAEADLVDGWPVSTPDRIGAVSVPALGDVDGDGDLEIFVGADHHFYGWHHDGTGIVNPDGEFLDGGSWLYGTAALADLDGDGVDDVVIGGGDDGLLYAVNGAAVALPGSWPVDLGGTLSSSPAIGDLDGDGSPEVVVVTMNDRVYVYGSDGSAFGYNWPATVTQNNGYSVCSSVSLADLNNDGTLEVVVGSSDTRAYAWQWDGTPLAGWPTAPTDGQITASPAIGDLDGDGVMEIVVATAGHNIYAWDINAAVVPGWPIDIGDSGSSPAIIDLDLDGDVDVAAGSVSSVMYIWDCDGPHNSDFVGWEQFHHDPARSGEHP